MVAEPTGPTAQAFMELGAAVVREIAKLRLQPRNAVRCAAPPPGDGCLDAAVPAPLLTLLCASSVCIEELGALECPCMRLGSRIRHGSERQLCTGLTRSAPPLPSTCPAAAASSTCTRPPCAAPTPGAPSGTAKFLYRLFMQ